MINISVSFCWFCRRSDLIFYALISRKLHSGITVWEVGVATVSSQMIIESFSNYRSPPFTTGTVYCCSVEPSGYNMMTTTPT